MNSRPAIQPTSVPSQRASLYLVRERSGRAERPDVRAGFRGDLRRHRHDPAQQFDLSPDMEGWIVSSATVGCIGSVLCAGWLSDSWGRKPALVLTGVLFLVSLIGSMLAIAPGMLAATRLIGGLGIGFSSVVAPMFIAEISPQRSVEGWYRSINWPSPSAFVFLLHALIGYLNGSSMPGSSPGFFHWIFVTEQWRGMFGACVIPSVACVFAPSSFQKVLDG